MWRPKIKLNLFTDRKRPKKKLQKEMVSSSQDVMSSSLFGTHTVSATIGIFCVLSLILLAWIKISYDTFSVPLASKRWKDQLEIRKRYEELFSTRSNLMYHISWAKSRGDKEEARGLMKELDKLDKVNPNSFDCSGSIAYFAFLGNR
jgi:hypothetical protein